jgi:YVTN family beta-propeller protein
VGGGGSSAQAGGGGSGGGGGGGGAAACTATATEGVRGAAVAISEDDGLVVAANRDSGTVSIFSTDLGGALPSVTKTSELAVGNGPWQVAIDPCGTRAFVVVREDQKVVAIDGLDTTPVVGASVVVGSEPTAIALSPNGTTLYVASWVDGTVSVIDVATLTVSKTVDLNATLAATGLLGDSVASPGRPAIAHPRSIAITNDGDADDTDETIVVTEFFAQRTAPEASGGGNVDSNWVGVLYRFDAATATPSAIDLKPLVDAGFTT